MDQPLVMDYTRLIVGLVLPWATGYFWLALAEHAAGRSHSANRLRQLGYGLFVGFALLYGVIVLQSYFTSHVSYGVTITVVAMLAVIGLLAHLRFVPRQIDTTTPALSTTQWVLLSVVLGLTALHLIMAWGEILNLPVYPWDAWLAWVYRAKAWYYSGYLAPMVSPQEWLAGSENYAMAASGYPTFASVMPMWAAISLGQWSETLVNTPVILCGLGLVFGLYGSCREHGLGLAASAIAAYLLVSIPIVGTHLSLAGYADIWMAGFAGLGFLALISGHIRQDRAAVCLGLLLIAFSTQIKQEGVVWLYLALATLVISAIRPRYLAGLVLALALLCITAAVTQTMAVSIPAIGLIGIENNQVHLPFVASVPLKDYPLLAPYKTAIFEHGSWQLLGALLVFSLVTLLLMIGRREARAPLILLISLVASQAFIFGFTEQGRWATSFTAINRLPMHVAPVLVFVVVIALTRLRPGMPGHRFSSAAAALALLITVSGIALLIQPKETNKTSLSISRSGEQMRVVMGAGKAEDETMTVTRFQNGFAIVSARGGRLQAEKFNHLELELTTDGSRAPSFFWRRADKPEDLTFLDVDNENSTIDLSEHPQWRGTITEFGVAFYEPGATHSSVRRISLSQATLANNATSLLDNWTATLPWNQQSINWIQLGQEKQRIHLVTVASAWIALALLLMGLTWLIPAQRRTAFAALPVTAAIAWLLLDLQWLNVRAERLGQTLNIARQAGPPYIQVGADQQMAELASHVKAAGLEPGDRVLMAAQQGPDAFEIQRLRYHLLPLSAVGAKQAVSTQAPNNVAAVLLVANPSQPDTQWLATKTQAILHNSNLQVASALSGPYAKLLVKKP